MSREEQQTTSTNSSFEQLDNIKRHALEALVPNLSKIEDLDPERKFDICLSAVRYTNDPRIAQVALESALAIEDTPSQSEALLQIIQEVDFLISEVAQP